MAQYFAYGCNMKKNETKLKELFELQNFSENPHLKRLIEETESRYGCELSDDMLDLVNAAGDMDAARLRKKDGGRDDE